MVLLFLSLGTTEMVLFVLPIMLLTFYSLFHAATSARAAYASLVDALDEMRICGINQYMIGEISPEEEALL